jgi:hypothetical protein
MITRCLIGVVVTDDFFAKAGDEIESARVRLAAAAAIAICSGRRGGFTFLSQMMRC